MPERFDNVYQINNFCLISVIRENAWDRPDSWQPISITMHLYVSRSPADISDDNNNSFDYGRMYRQVKDLVDRRSFHCIDHVGWSLSRLCHAWPVQLVKIKVFTPRRTSRDEGGMKKEWIWLRDKETHHRHFAAQKLIFENLEIDCIIGDNPHERARKQTVRVTIQVDGEDNKPSTCPGLPETGHIDWKGLVGGIYEVGGVLKAHCILWFVELILCLAFYSSWKPHRVGPCKHLPCSLRNSLSRSTHSCAKLACT